jgi:riboflavin kinase/FMN adenylyltransferase
LTPVVVRGSENFDVRLGRPVVTIGNFDGVHLGHRALVDAAKRLAKGERPVCVYTFDPPPRDVMAPGNGVSAIQSLEDKISLLGEAGADIVVVETFTRAFAAREASFFAQCVLGERLCCSGVVVGWDFRFGRGRAGDHTTLRALLDVPIHRVEAIEVAGGVASSSRVRRLVEAGEVAAAAQVLGRPHELLGEVVAGDGRGRTIGVPTANVQVETRLRPSHGVYAVRVDVGDGTWLPGVANYGIRPTVGEGHAPLEVHLLQGGRDLYGVRLCVGLVQKIRDERKFSSVEALVRRIGDDVREARRILGVPE